MKDKLEKSKYKYLLDLNSISEVFKEEIVKYSIVELKYINNIIYKFTIKYQSTSQIIYYIKKNDDYDFNRVKKLMALLSQKEKQKLHIFNTKDSELIASQSVTGIELINSMSISNIKLIALKLSKFHNYPLNYFSKYLNQHNANIKEIRFIAKRDTIEIIEKHNKKIANKLLDLYQKIIEIENDVLAKNKHYLIHGDLHPGNIVIYKNKAHFIDYKNICSGLKERDVATILEQIYALKKQGKISTDNKKIEKFQETFLNSYKNKLDPNLILFYKSWISWRNALYCFMKFYNNRVNNYRYEDALLFLKNSEKYLKEYKELI
ncbi:MAG: hypothetical protein PF488_01320 [Patescibacteria group bacterium]|jgi:hypothetical protein|nr:hypothetical protein [Patescibacteria group bacterium]